MKWLIYAIVPIAVAVSGASATQPLATDFVEQCVTALEKEGRSKQAADAACDCVARRTTDRPELRDEFLVQIVGQKNGRVRSSTALRQVRASCVPMPIWAQGDEG